MNERRNPPCGEVNQDAGDPVKRTEIILETITDVADLLGLEFYNLNYLLQIGRVDEPELRVAGKRIWTEGDVKQARAVLDGQDDDERESTDICKEATDE